ncbi:MAG: magnesium chelatase [Candidatus Zixiibacteriota bacterium]|nr:MAG: magnesium chelatase [candidate division Zixibacteria bacterium]
MKRPKTLRELKASGYRSRSTKTELRENMIEQIRAGKSRWPGIIGYERTVLPLLENAILSQHDILLLGLRGQAKTRILRHLVNFLDEYLPVIKGSPLNEDPFRPITSRSKRLVTEAGDELPIDWLPRELRYSEKLATPDVSVADLIGDLDPIKAVREKLDLSDEEVIHWGIVPRTNRGIFAINELPDLQPRIQVALLNILEENDFQIRGFPIRVPLDMMLAFTANPEDYTNRGNIITPLKDRIASQINTHYPSSIEIAKVITQQEAWTDRSAQIEIPELIRDIIEQIAFEARSSEHVDQGSGVSARLTISAYENLLSNIERRAAVNKDNDYYPRICDLYAVLSSIVGKVELVYEGELEGPSIVAVNMIGEATKKAFGEYFPAPRKPKGHMAENQRQQENVYEPIIDFFASGRRLELSDELPYGEYQAALSQIVGLREIAQRYFKPKNERETVLAMEFVLEGLHRHNIIAKESPDNKFVYIDMLENILKD